MTDRLGPETQELVRRARESDRMPAAYKRQLKGAVLARIALASQGTLAAGQATRFGTSFGAKAVVAVAVAGAVALGVGGYRALRPTRSSAPIGARHTPAAVAAVAPEAAPTAAAAVAPETAPTAAAAVVAVEATPAVAVEPALAPPPPPKLPPRGKRGVERAVARAEARTAARAEAHTETGAEPGTLDSETALLREADRALRDGNTAKATAKLDEHAALFPNGTLSPERVAERLLVACRAADADPRAVAQFLATSPGSPLAARVRRQCAIAPSAPAPAPATTHSPSTGQTR